MGVKIKRITKGYCYPSLTFLRQKSLSRRSFRSSNTLVYLELVPNAEESKEKVTGERRKCFACAAMETEVDDPVLCPSWLALTAGNNAMIERRIDMKAGREIRHLVVPKLA
ncbi:hypothetical protein R1flu_025587 [Riccia fluitans]|uniref:Uncharacterized protein n=1 Tax=Riccia fluitans TaxID=41844 RepID=A0ABD1XY59_9MARC